MIDKNINVVAARDLWKKEIDGFLPILVEVYNPDIRWDSPEYGQDNGYMRLINGDDTVIYKNHRWLPCNLEYSEPETDGQKIGSASITISAIDARVRQLLRTINVSCEMRIAAIYAKQEIEEGRSVYKFMELSTKPFTMSTASSNSMTATFNLEPDMSLSQNVPFETATPDRCPAVSE